MDSVHVLTARDERRLRKAVEIITEIVGLAPDALAPNGAAPRRRRRRRAAAKAATPTPRRKRRMPLDVEPAVTVEIPSNL